MIVLDRKHTKKSYRLTYILLGISVIIFILNGVFGAGYIEIMLGGAVFGAGMGSLLNLLSLKKRYAKYFEEGKEIVVSELISETGTKEIKVLQELNMFITPKERKLLKTTDVVKFQNS